MIECRIVLEYGSEDMARAVFGSVELDNRGFISGKVEDKRIVFEISGENPMSLSHTINDLLACVKAAENSLLL